MTAEARKLTTLAFAHKVAWEGGITATLNYGISPDELEDPEVAACWGRLHDHYDAMQADMEWLDERLREARKKPAP
jgi:hypothetical protein